MTEPSYDLRPAMLDDIRPLIERFHGYRSVGDVATAVFAVYDRDRIVAGYVWNPPAPGAAAALAPSAPWSVLALTRMVAVPRDVRSFHVSRPLRRQMRMLLDRGRWPVPVTYSDASQGHTGHVYLCSGWTKEATQQRRIYADDSGARRSCYSNGKTSVARYNPIGTAAITRWTHRACPAGEEAAWMERHGWTRRPIEGKTWRSGRQAFELLQVAP